MTRLKKIIGLFIAGCLLFSSVAVYASPETEKQQLEEQKQVIEQQIVETQNDMSNAHVIAETARGMGLSEEDSIIVRAKELWSENHTKKVELETQLAQIAEKLEILAKYKYVGVFKLTGYCNCSKCCGHSSGKTASGTYPVEGRTVAASKQFPFGTKLYIEGLGEYIVEDRGGFASNVIDMYSNTHSGCYRAEYNQSVRVYVIND